MSRTTSVSSLPQWLDIDSLYNHNDLVQLNYGSSYYFSQLYALSASPWMDPPSLTMLLRRSPWLVSFGPVPPDEYASAVLKTRICSWTSSSISRAIWYTSVPSLLYMREFVNIKSTSLSNSVVFRMTCQNRDVNSQWMFRVIVAALGDF